MIHFQEQTDTARPITALGGGAAIGIPDFVTRPVSGVPGFAQHQNLVTADAQVAVGNARSQIRAEREFPAPRIDQHEVISRPVHLVKFDRHRKI